MFGSSENKDAWGTAHGGFRGSTVLRVGAVLAALAVLLESAGPVITGSPVWGLSILAWTLWILALMGLGLGFLLIGLNPAMSRVGIFVGVGHLLHAALLLVRIFTVVNPVFAPKAGVTGRLLLIVVFAVWERKELGRRNAIYLGAAAVFVLVKALLPLFGVDPVLGAPAAFLRDAVPAVLLAVALYHTGDVVRSREDKWARDQGVTPNSGFEDYDNPFNAAHRDPPQK